MEINEIHSFIEYYDKIRARTNRLIGVIAPEHMNFTYQPGKFTIADQIRHIAATERYMFAENVMGRKSCYKGCGPALADGYEHILSFFNDLHSESVAIFKSLTPEDLKRKCPTPGNIEIPVWKWLRCMVEHEIHHRAQLYLYLNMLNVETPPIFGMRAEEVEKNSV